MRLRAAASRGALRDGGPPGGSGDSNRPEAAIVTGGHYKRRCRPRSRTRGVLVLLEAGVGAMCPKLRKEVQLVFPGRGVAQSRVVRPWAGHELPYVGCPCDRKLAIRGRQVQVLAGDNQR